MNGFLRFTTRPFSAIKKSPPWIAATTAPRRGLLHPSVPLCLSAKFVQFPIIFPLFYKKIWLPNVAMAVKMGVKSLINNVRYSGCGSSWRGGRISLFLALILAPITRIGNRK
jgi:hypothetical protein